MYSTPIDPIEDPPIGRDEKYEYTDTAPEFEDPFGNEEFAEVKYRTMAWW